MIRQRISDKWNRCTWMMAKTRSLTSSQIKTTKNASVKQNQHGALIQADPQDSSMPLFECIFFGAWSDPPSTKGASRRGASRSPLRSPFEGGGVRGGGGETRNEKGEGGLLEGGFARNEKGFSPSTKGGFEKGFSFLAKGGFEKGGFSRGASRGASRGLRRGFEKGGFWRGLREAGGGSFRFSRRGGFEAPLLEAPSKPLQSPPWSPLEKPPFSKPPFARNEKPPFSKPPFVRNEKPPFSKPPFARNEKPPFSKPAFVRNEKPLLEAPLREKREAPLLEAPLREKREAPLPEAPLEKPPFAKTVPKAPFQKPPFSKPPLWETRSLLVWSSFEKPRSPLFRFSARTTTTTTTTTSLAPTTYTKTCPACTSPFLKPTHGRHTFSPPGRGDEGSKGRSLRRGLQGLPKPSKGLQRLRSAWRGLQGLQGFEGGLKRGFKGFEGRECSFSCAQGTDAALSLKLPPGTLF